MRKEGIYCCFPDLARTGGRREGVGPKLWGWRCPFQVELPQGRHTFRWWSEDSKSWDGPHETPVVGIVPDKLEDLGESGHGMRGPEVRRLRGQYPPASGQESTVREVDYDSSFTPDTGYSGWVRLSDGRIFCVNYIIDDWPTAQIRGYWLDESFLA